MVNKYPQAFRSQCDKEDLAPRLALPSSLSTRAKVAPQGARGQESPRNRAMLLNG